MDTLEKIFLSAGSVTVGIIFGILRSKIFASKSATKLHYLFYIFAGAVALTAAIYLIKDWRAMVDEENYFAITILISCILLGIALLVISIIYLPIKDIYRSEELDPIVEKFTSKADKDVIKLFGGDLNFFGNDPAQMDINKQYTHLKSLRFRQVLILCETPKDNTQKIRYGKILTEINGAELRFYNPDTADLKVRGRIITVNGVDGLLMYSRIQSKVYQAIETDTANSNGALYNNIWELVWDMALRPGEQILQQYMALSNNR